jgi:hypothetical protein
VFGCGVFNGGVLVFSFILFVVGIGMGCYFIRCWLVGFVRIWVVCWGFLGGGFFDELVFWGGASVFYVFLGYEGVFFDQRCSVFGFFCWWGEGEWGF